MRYMVYNKSINFWRITMSIQLAAKPFNYHSEIRAAADFLDSDEVLAHQKHKEASAKNKCLNNIMGLFNEIQFKTLPHCLVQMALTRPEAKYLVETFLGSFVALFNAAPTHIDLRNKASFEFFEALSKNLADFENATPKDTYTLKNLTVDPSQIEIVNKLADNLIKLGTTDAASSVLATCLGKTHPTHQQDIARAYLDAMLDITASHSDKVDPDVLKMAEYVSAYGENIGLPYI